MANLVSETLLELEKLLRGIDGAPQVNADSADLILMVGDFTRSAVRFVGPTDNDVDDDDELRYVSVECALSIDVEPTAELFEWIATSAEARSVNIKLIPVVNQNGRNYLCMMTEVLSKALTPRYVAQVALSSCATAEKLTPVVLDKFGGQSMVQAIGR